MRNKMQAFKKTMTSCLTEYIKKVYITSVETAAEISRDNICFIQNVKCYFDVVSWPVKKISSCRPPALTISIRTGISLF